MASSPNDAKPPDSNQIDHLSHLPDALLIAILWFLPTRVAARTALLSRHFRRIWKDFPLLELTSRGIHQRNRDKFFAMVDQALSHPVSSLRLEISSSVGGDCDSLVSSLLTKVCSLSLSHLVITLDSDIFLSYDYLLRVLPAIFSMKSLISLSLPTIIPSLFISKKEDVLPSAITLTRLRSLSIENCDIFNATQFSKLLSELVSLEDLQLGLSDFDDFTISSQTIKNLKLTILADHFSFLLRSMLDSRRLRPDILRLSLPLLEIFHLVNCGACGLPYFQGEVPLLRKAVLNLDCSLVGYFSEVASSVVRDNRVDCLLNYLSHVQVLSLSIYDSEHEIYPFPILWDQGEDPPKFHNLKHLDVCTRFDKNNFLAVISMLDQCPALESIKLEKELPKSTGSENRRTRKDWKSKLPRNANHNFPIVHIRDLHLGENRKNFLKAVSKKWNLTRRE